MAPKPSSQAPDRVNAHAAPLRSRGKNGLAAVVGHSATPVAEAGHRDGASYARP